MESADKAEDVSDITRSKNASAFILSICFYIIDFIFENPLSQ